MDMKPDAGSLVVDAESCVQAESARTHGYSRVLVFAFTDLP
jgi:hypothetical protein